MRELDPTACFDRYRRDGDPAALAYVFDHTAPELLRVARRLTRNGDESEDLLQSTFVAAIVGRVVDGTGAPVAGARVRAGQVQTGVMMFGLQHYRSGDGFAFLHPEETLCGDVPAWIDQLLTELLPATQTDAEGRFELPRISAGPQSVMVDAPGFVPAEKTVDCGVGARNDAGEIRIEGGVEWHGRVVDADGAPLEGIDVRVGYVAMLPMAAVMHPVGSTDATGRLRVTNSPSRGAAFVAARRAPHHPWSLKGPLSFLDDVEIEMTATADRAVRCVDADGNPVTDVEIYLSPNGTGSDPVSKRRSWYPVGRADPADDASSEGLFWLRDLAEGTYQVRAVSRSRGLLEDVLHVPDGLAATTLLFDGPRTVEVVVVDAETSAPVEWALASLHASENESGAPLFQRRSDSDGHVSLGPVGSTHRNAYSLRIEHPGFARVFTPIVPSDEAVTIALRSGGTVRGRVLDAGAAPTEPLRVTLKLEDDEPGVGIEHDLPWMQRVGDDGSFAIDSLPDGRFRITVDTPNTDRDGLAMFSMQVVEPRATRRVVVTSGRVTTVELDVSRSRGTATVQGTLRLDGTEAAQFAALVHASGKTLRATTDGAGHFTIDAIPAGRARLSIGRPVKVGGRTLADLFCNRELELQPGEVRTLEFDFTSIDVKVTAVDATTGAPIAGATVKLTGVDDATSGFHDQGSTGPDGTGTLLTLREGDYKIVVDHPDVGRGAARNQLPRAGGEPIRIELKSGVPCAGRLLLPDMIQIAADDDVEIFSSNGDFERLVRTTGNELSFNVRGAEPGTYTVILYAGDDRDGTCTFDLPATGKADLVLTLHGP